MAWGGSLAAYGFLSRFEVCGASPDVKEKIYCAIYGAERGAPRNGLLFWVAGQNKLIAIDTPGRLHSVVQSPTDAGLLFGMSKAQTKAYFVDLSKKKILSEISSPPGFEFYGHATFSADGKRLYTSEQAVKGRVGWIGVREAQTGKLLSRFPSNGFKPHVCTLLADGTLGVVNTAGQKRKDPSNFSIFDLKTESVKEKIDFGSNQCLTHFLQDSAGWKIFGGYTYSSSIAPLLLPAVMVVCSPNGKQTTLQLPKEYAKDWFGEAAAFTLDETRGLVVTSSYVAKNTYRFDYKKGTFRDVILGTDPKGFAMDSPENLIAIDEGPHLIQHFASETLKSAGGDIVIPADMALFSPHLEALFLTRGRFL